MLEKELKNPRQVRGIFPNNSLSQEIVKCQIAYKLLQGGWEVYLEQELKTCNGRADVLAINVETGIIVEVLDSETEEEFRLNKLSKYPTNFQVSCVKCKDFDINTWYP